LIFVVCSGARRPPAALFAAVALAPSDDLLSVSPRWNRRFSIEFLASVPDEIVDFWRFTLPPSRVAVIVWDDILSISSRW